METRRTFLSRTGTAVATALAAPWIAGPSFGKDHPNVLFIVVDDLNDWIGCLGGHPDARTPNIDRLARRGVNFTRAYCNAPACNPSRASLMTGLRPSTTGVYGNRHPFRRARPDAVTIGMHLRENGYRIIGRGKIFHTRYPDPRTWDQFVRRGSDPVPPRRPMNGIPNAKNFDWGPLDADDAEMDDTKVVAWCGDRLSERADQPRFLACGVLRPHLPWYVPRKYFDMFPPELITLPEVNPDDLDDVPRLGRRMSNSSDHETIVETGNWRGAVSAYLACVAFVDARIGQLMEAFEASPDRDNTVICFFGDHGWHLGEKLHWKKFSLWEEATRAPLVLAAPGVTKPGTRCDRTVSFLDLYPTLSDLCGVPNRPEAEGESLRPLLQNPDAEWDRPAVTTWGKENHSVRSERWRYTRYSDGTEELYDHNVDPLEWTNLAAKEQLASVKAEHARWLPKLNAEEGPQDAYKDRTIRDALKRWPWMAPTVP